MTFVDNVEIGNVANSKNEIENITIKSVHSDYLFDSKNKIKRLHRVVVLFIVPLEHVIVDLEWTRQVSVNAIGQHCQSVDGSYQVGVTRHAPYKQKKKKEDDNLL